MTRLPILQKNGDFDACERSLAETLTEHPMRLLGYRLIPNRWHPVLWPAAEGELTAFVRWLT
jgi:putative transposase